MSRIRSEDDLGEQWRVPSSIFGAVDRDCRSICRRSGGAAKRRNRVKRRRPGSRFVTLFSCRTRSSDVRRLRLPCAETRPLRGEGLRTESGSVARPAIARTGCMNSECGPSIHRKSVIYLCSTPQVQIRDVPRRHIFPAAWPGREMIFRPSALPEDSLTGTVRNISDEFGRNVRRKAVSYRNGADSRSCGRTAIRILYYRKSGRGKSSYESVPTHGITCERRGPSRGGHPFP